MLGVQAELTAALLLRFSAVAGGLGSFPSSLQVSEVGRPQLHLSKLNGVLMTFPVEPVHSLGRTNAVTTLQKRDVHMLMLATTNIYAASTLTRPPWLHLSPPSYVQ